MKYYSKVILEDKDVFQGFTEREISDITGYTVPYINMLVNGRRIAPLKTYVDIKAKLEAYRTLLTEN